jgi:hypothetical protein
MAPVGPGKNKNANRSQQKNEKPPHPTDPIKTMPPNNFNIRQDLNCSNKVLQFNLTLTAIKAYAG